MLYLLPNVLPRNIQVVIFGSRFNFQIRPLISLASPFPKLCNYTNQAPLPLLPVDTHLSRPINFHGCYSIFHARHSTLLGWRTQHLQRQSLEIRASIGAQFGVLTTIPTIRLRIADCHIEGHGSSQPLENIPVVNTPEP